MEGTLCHMHLMPCKLYRIELHVWFESTVFRIYIFTHCAHNAWFQSRKILFFQSCIGRINWIVPASDIGDGKDRQREREREQSNWNLMRFDEISIYKCLQRFTKLSPLNNYENCGYITTTTTTTIAMKWKQISVFGFRDEYSMKLF